MKRREQWCSVLDAETTRWKAKPWKKLVSELAEEQVYEVEFETKKFQVEVQLLENADTYIHVCVSVDDGSLPASLSPETSSFMLNKE
jgi:hypothetical protein